MKRRQFIQAGAGASLAMMMAEVMGESREKGAELPPWASARMSKSSEGLYSPTRHVFAADRFSNFISVTDIVSGAHVTSLDFCIRPHVMEMSRDSSMMAVGSPESKWMYFMDLRTLKRQRVDLPSPLFQMFFVPQSTLVAVALRDQVGMIDYSDFSVRIFPRRFDSDQRQALLNTYYSLLFSSFSKSFWVLDEDRPFIYHKDGDSKSDDDWRTIDLSKHIGSGSGLGIGVASTEDDLLAITTDDGSEGLVYFPQQDRILSTGPMRTVGTTNEPMIMPYIDAYTQHVIFADVQGNVALFDLKKGDEKPQRFTVDFSPRFIRTGWLESTWILAGDKGIMFQSFDDPSDRRIDRFRPEIMSVWVTGDSKTALYSLDEWAPQIFRYDIRTRRKLKPIRVRGVTMPAMLRMGSNNSICY